MVPHYAEVNNLETVVSFGPGEEGQEKIFDFASVKEHLTVIDACGYMIPGAFEKQTGFSHVTYTLAI